MGRTIRAKFRASRFEAELYSRPRLGPDGRPNWNDIETVERRTVVLVPVSGNGDPEHENTRFWNATPTGEIKLGTINREAWEAFELGREYYVDFTLAG